MKRLMALGLCFAGAAALAGAEVRAQYRIVMRDGQVVVARDLPKQKGSVTTFHNEAGVLTGVPSEDVARVDTSVTPKRFTGGNAPAIADDLDTLAHPLQPGEVMVLGPIGDGGTGSSIAAQAGAAGALGGGANAANGANANGGGNFVNGNGVNANGVNNGNFVNGNGTFSSGAPVGTGTIDPRMLGGGTGLLPNGQQANSPLAGDVMRAQSCNVPTMNIDTQTQTSPNGFPANTASQTTTLNPNGTPNTTTTGPVAGSTAPIGPNGFPGTPQNVTGPNGFPTTGGTATSSQNVTGPNGFQGPNGSTPQNVTNPNGFPATGAAGTGTTGTTTNGGAVIVAPNGTITNTNTNTNTNANAPGTPNGQRPNTSGVQQQQGNQSKSGAAAPNGGGQPGASAPASPSSGAPSGGPGH